MTRATRNFAPFALSKPKRIVLKNTTIGKLWKQLRVAFNVIFRILQYNIDIQIGERVSSIAKEGQGGP